MKILCKDKKILELDNTFLSFSKTLVAMQKYSNNQIVEFNFLQLLSDKNNSRVDFSQIFSLSRY